MRGAKYILALTLAMAGASALAYNGGYENHYIDEMAGYDGYGNDDIMYAEPFPNAAKNQVFAQCRAATSLNLSGQGVSEIGNASFAYMRIPTLTIPSSVQSVGYISFGGCSNLTEVSCDSWNWANGTANIEDKEPFRDCFNLKTIKVSGDAAEPPTSFDVTVIFTELTTVYCPESKVSLWQAAYPSLTISGVPEATTATLGLQNGKFAAFSAASPEEAAAIASAMSVELTEEDEAAGLDVQYLRAVAAPVGGVVLPGQGNPDSFSSAPMSGDVSYYAYIDVNPDTVPAPIIGSGTGSPMSVVQGPDGVEVGIVVNNAIQGLWYGCEAKDSLAEPFANDIESFRRAPEGGVVVIPCTKRTSEAAFFRVKVAASKPTE